jgi:hypothetical protein
LTVIGRSLSDETGNGFIVPKGVMWTLSQGLEAWRAKAGGSVQLTQLSAECWWQYGVLFRGRKAKDREESCERCYLPVCSHLTLKNGDRLKRLDGHENEKPWNAGLLFYFFEKTKE